MSKVKKKVGDYQIPFDKNGNQVSYAGGGYDVVRLPAGVTMVPNFEFDDFLTYVGFERGRSAAHLVFFRNSNGCKVRMFLTDFDAVIRTLPIINGSVKGRWTFRKRGENYGCVLVK